jgi:hypothetical protein
MKKTTVTFSKLILRRAVHGAERFAQTMVTMAVMMVKIPMV